MDKKPTKKYQLCVEKIQTLEDMKKIINGLYLRIDTDDELYDDLKEFFCLEVVPQGYGLLLKEIGYDEMAKLSFHEIEEQALNLINQNKKEKTGEE